MAAWIAQGAWELMAGRCRTYARVAREARAEPHLRCAGWILGATFLILGILDIASTNLALSRGAQEANLVVYTIMAWIGPYWVLPKLAFQGLVSAMVIWSPNRPTLAMMAFCCAWTAMVVHSNFGIAASLA